jgi:hypothetical protein
MPTISISIDELLYGLSQSEKDSLYYELSEELNSSSVNSDIISPARNLTPMEKDIQQTLIAIWDKRILLTPAQRQTLTDVLNASSI